MDEFAKRSVFVKSGKFRYLGINFAQTAHDGTSFVKKQGTIKCVEDWTSIPQLQNGFNGSRKFCLNFYSRK